MMMQSQPLSDEKDFRAFIKDAEVEIPESEDMYNTGTYTTNNENQQNTHQINSQESNNENYTPSTSTDQDQEYSGVNSTAASASGKMGIIAKMLKFKNIVADKIKNTRFTRGKQKQKAVDENKFMLATRFIAFDQECMLVLIYIKNKPYRDYSIFNSHPDDTSRPIPAIQWDSMVTKVYQLH